MGASWDADGVSEYLSHSLALGRTNSLQYISLFSLIKTENAGDVEAQLSNCERARTDTANQNKTQRHRILTTKSRGANTQ